MTCTLWLGSGSIRPGEVFSEVLPWLAVLLGLVIAGTIVLTVMRRRLREADEGSASEGFTLHDLRQLRASGQLSEEEFERAKAAIIARVRSTTSEKDEDGADAAGGGNTA